MTDLGVGIGSAEWFRGLAVCAALCYSALSLSPGFRPLPGDAPAPLTDAHMEEARAYAFSPLAYGADTGRRMAPVETVRPLLDAPERPTVDLTSLLGTDSLARALERAGVGRSDAASAQAMVAGAVPLSDLKPGTLLQLTLGRRPEASAPRPLDSLSFRARFDLRVEVRRVNDRLAINPVPIAVDSRPLRIQGLVGPSLYQSARASGAPPKAVEAYIRAIAAQTDIMALDPGDRFDIIVEQRRAETGETELGRLLFAGLNRADGGALRLVQWVQDGTLRWFEASGVGKESGTLQRPVPGSISSSFGMRRHPILGYSRMHKGLDFQAGYGTPIVAATDGQVAAAGWAGGYGRQVRLNHPGGLATTYSHMSRIVASPGEMVRQGQLIGYVGSTGLSTGPHLHYELYANGVPVNPMSVKFVRRAQISGPELVAFQARLRRLLSLPVGRT